MSPLDKRELEGLRFDLESDRVVRMSSVTDAIELRPNTCALANDPPVPARAGIVGDRYRSGERPFDHRPADNATVEHLGLQYFESRYLPKAATKDVLNDTRRSPAQQLRSLRLLVGDTPTWGALLGFGRNPQEWIPAACVRFLRIDGTEFTDPIRSQRVLTGRLEDVLRQLDELLKRTISARTEATTVSRELPSLDYPVAALQQLARNAVMHRSYEDTNAPAHVHWYSDRVEIRSPGGLYGHVTPENFGTGAIDHRNPLVAEIMHHLGFAQRFGLGVPLARKELKDNGNPEPRFDFQPNQVVVSVRPPHDVAT